LSGLSKKTLGDDVLGGEALRAGVVLLSKFPVKILEFSLAIW
jgi:hypothetical protein